MEPITDNDVQEQPEKDSQDVIEEQDSEDVSEEFEEDEQPEEDSLEDSEEAQERTIEIDGKDYTLDEIRSNMMMQSDYTKSKQELAAQQRELAKMIETIKKPEVAEDEIPADVKAALATLKQHGVATQEDIKKEFQLLHAQQEDEQQFKQALTSNPELKKHAEFIKAYGYQHSKVSWADIFSKFRKQLGLEAKSKLDKARNSKDPKGEKNIRGQKTNKNTELEQKFLDNLPPGFRIKT